MNIPSFLLKSLWKWKLLFLQFLLNFLRIKAFSSSFLCLPYFIFSLTQTWISTNTYLFVTHCKAFINILFKVFYSRTLAKTNFSMHSGNYGICITLYIYIHVWVSFKIYPIPFQKFSPPAVMINDMSKSLFSPSYIPLFFS